MDIIDGRMVSKGILDKLAKKIKSNLKLVAIFVGNNPASQSYLKIKKFACNTLGVGFEIVKFDEFVDSQVLLNKIGLLNQDPLVSGILLQLPLPKNLDERIFLQAIDKKKDVDCLNPSNFKNLVNFNNDSFYHLGNVLLPPTSKGILYLFSSIGLLDFKGKHVVIVGAGKLVGLPMAILMSKLNATVTVCNEFTQDLKNQTLQADILITGVGKPSYITNDMLKDNVIIIDAGINHISLNGKAAIVGDVDFENMKNKASYITPVPGGVGPMTVACLLENLVLLNKNLNLQ